MNEICLHHMCTESSRVDVQWSNAILLFFFTTTWTKKSANWISCEICWQKSRWGSFYVDIKDLSIWQGNRIVTKMTVKNNNETEKILKMKLQQCLNSNLKTTEWSTVDSNHKLSVWQSSGCDLKELQPEFKQNFFQINLLGLCKRHYSIAYIHVFI